MNIKMNRSISINKWNSKVYDKFYIHYMILFNRCIINIYNNILLKLLKKIILLLKN